MPAAGPIARSPGSDEPEPPHKSLRAPFEARDALVLGGAAVFATVCALVAQFGGLPRLQPLVGVVVIMSFAYAMW